jgi:enoyl-CoA hydratase
VNSWTVEYHDAIALLTFTRAPDNVYLAQSLFELEEILDRISRETGRVKVVVLAGGLDGYFINHGDISDRPDFIKFGADGRLRSREFEAWLDIFNRIEDIPQPTIAAIDGLAAGGGSEMALACTMRVGSPRARLQQSEITSGVIVGGGSSVRLPRLVGPGIAAEAILTGRVFEADEARRVGWLNAILPAEGFIDHALKWAHGVARHSSLSLFAVKELLQESARLPLADALRREREIFLGYLSDSGVMSGPPQE